MVGYFMLVQVISV